MEEWKNRFLETKQASRKLQIALEHYDHGLSDEWRKLCGSYLRQRIRPAMEAVICGSQVKKLELLLQEDWVTDSILEDAIKKAAQLGRTEIAALLLDEKKSRQPGFAEAAKTQEHPAFPAINTRRKHLTCVCESIWKLALASLCSRYPFFRSYFLHLKFQIMKKEQQSFHGIGQMGNQIIYDPKYLIRAFRKGTREVEQLLLHMMAHTLLLHTVMMPGENEMLWNLACDLCAERFLRYLDEEKSSERQGGFLPQEIYACLTADSLSPEEIEEKACSHQVDDHGLWKQLPQREMLELMEQPWNRIPRSGGAGALGMHAGFGGKGGSLAEHLTIDQPGKMDLHRYLRKFAVAGEELLTDLDSIDYIPYLYGLAHYGNMPLVEHLEYQEVHRIQELVIAIDTSGSCKKETVQRFMEEVYGILSHQENFFQKMNVFVLQCDFMVQHAVQITCEKEWKEYLAHLVIHGRSDTDFQPVFQYIEKLRSEKKLKNLKGLLYFTDGDGIYPGQAPDYETAFLYYHRKKNAQKVPGWVRQFEIEDWEIP